MAITRQKKESLLKSATETLQNTLAIVFVSFRGLTVSEVNELRAALKKEEVKYTVVKKTLLKKALDTRGYRGDMPELTGEVAFAYLTKGDDITAPARNVQAYIKKFRDKIAFLGGVLEGKYLSKSDIMSVATIPATPILRGMFANIINSPLARFAVALGEVSKKKASA